MTGEQLFRMYVGMGLCTTFVYEWDNLSTALQGRWNRWAEQLTLKAN
jgi:hypothetical protein